MKEAPFKKRIQGHIRIPGSKSLTHRALIAAALAEGESRLVNALGCEDTFYTMQTLRNLGIDIISRSEACAVLGKGGRFQKDPDLREVFLGNSGTSFRLLLSTVSLAHGDFILTGSPRMMERPVGELVDALNRLGVDMAYEDRYGFPPVRVRARGISGGRTCLTMKQSSQFLSSLLLAGPYAEKDLTVEVRGDPVSRPYVDLTLEVMDRFGVSVTNEDYRTFRIPAGTGYHACVFPVEGDASSASYFWAAAAVTGGRVTTENIDALHSGQGDIRFLEILEAMGCRVERQEDGVTVVGGGLRGIHADMKWMPDMVPTLAAVALFADGRTVIRNVPHLRHKESDRIRGICIEWRKLGGRVAERSDGLIIDGGYPLRGTVVDPHNDHRLAMSLAVVGTRVPGIRIRRPECVNKSFPKFWELWEGLKQ